MMFSAANTTGDTARLEDYLSAIRARKWVVLAFTAACLALAWLFVSTRTNQYTGTATVVLAPTPVGSVNANLVNPNLEKEREIVLANETAADVVALLDLDDEPRALLRNADVAFRPDSDVMSIDYTNTNAEIASSYANAFAESYVTQREGSAIGFYQSRIETATTQRDQLRDDLDDVAAEIADLNRNRSEVLASFDDPEERTGPLAAVDDDLAAARATRADINSQLRLIETAIRADNATLASRTPAAQLLRTAEPPSAPNGLPANLLYAAGLALGLLLGIVTAFLLERLDTTASNDEAVGLALGSSVIGSVSKLGFGNRSGKAALVMLTTGGSSRLSSVREAFRRLRSSVQFLRSAEEVRALIVTSATPNEGKSVVSANLAIALAQAGERVALVNADMRRPTQEERFEIVSTGPGLSEYLGGEATLELEQVRNVSNLWLLPAGITPANPGELLGSNRFSLLIDELKDQLDYIIVDTPPILSTADALAASTAVDGVAVVVDSRRTESNELLQVRADLERSGANLVGAILNKTKFSRGGLFRRDRYAYYRAAKQPRADRPVPESDAKKPAIDETPTPETANA